jgi:RNA polymerase sigma factor (sigma-70 family)
VLWRVDSVEAVEVSDQGDETTELVRSFDSFFEGEYRRVLAFAAVICGRRAVAEELTQEAFFAAFRRWSTIGAYNDPGGWVRRVVANLATSAWRTRVREARALARVWHRQDPMVELEGTDDEFWVAVRALPSRQAQCVTLRYLEDRGVDDIAEVLGIAAPTVRVHLHEGRVALARQFGDSLKEDEG